MTSPPFDVARENSVESWLADHANLAALVVVLAGFVARVWVASGTFLNPDEALHFRIANQVSLDLVYRASLAESHPPLLYWVLHCVRWLGTSEIWLRLPSVIAGTVFCWLLFRWLNLVMGRLPGFIGLLLVALLPPVVRLSAEVRQYALLLMFLAGALYFLERAMAEGSAWWMATSAVCLYLGMLSHYSALFFAVALGGYGLLKIFARPPEPLPGKLIAIWTAAQLGALALLLFLYETHLSRLGRGESRTVLQGWMSEFYLSRSYFEAGRDNPFLFVIGHSFGVFQFIFGQLAVGDIAGLLFLLSLGLLWRGSAERSRRQLVLFFVLLFGLACGASLAHLYPYGGTRHSAFLIIPAIAGVSFALSWFAAQNWTRGLILALAIIAMCAIFGRQHQPYITRADQSRAHMTEAIEFLRGNVASGGLILSDYESSLVLGHYLCEQKPVSVHVSNAQFETFNCNGYRVVAANRTTATNFTPEVFLGLGPGFVSTFEAKAGDPVWIFQAGWGVDLPEGLRGSPEFHDLQFHAFGNNIKIFKLTAGETLRATVLR
jgi:uncharacterized membrane protein